MITFCSYATIAQSTIKDHSFRWSVDYVKDKNFFFLSLLERTPEVQSILSENDYFNHFLSNEKSELKKINQLCSLDVECFADAFKLKSEEISKIGEELASISELPEIKNLLEELRQSATYYLHNQQKNQDYIQSVWNDCSRGINQIINVYALAGEQKYPRIDSASYDVNGPYFSRLIDSMVEMMSDDTSQYQLFFQTSLQFALHLLDLNDRNEAARFEPMQQNENSAAFRSIAKIDWKRYPYSVILVPGHGPDEPKVALSPLAKMRNRLAAERYHKGMAPLIIASGGYVHPFQTEYCEALEMKKDLMERHQVPEEAIIIEPHARHTTTNFRNASRLIYRYGIPTNMKALCTTTKGQSYYITDMSLDQRCEQELGYVPYILKDRLSIHDVEWLPKIEALHIDPIDPLDP